MTEDTAATYQKFTAMKEAIAHLRVRDKRAIFLLMRTAADQLTVDTFFPLQGFTAGEFAVGQVLAENNRKNMKTNESHEYGCANDYDVNAVVSVPNENNRQAAEVPKKRCKSKLTVISSSSPRNKLLTRSRPGVKKKNEL
jgi:hypothetical protein